MRMVLLTHDECQQLAGQSRLGGDSERRLCGIVRVVSRISPEQSLRPHGRPAKIDPLLSSRAGMDAGVDRKHVYHRSQ